MNNLKLKAIRTSKNKTQKEVAEILNVDQSLISKIEKGLSVLNSDQIVKLCKALNCTSDYLLGLIDSDN